MLLKLRSPQSVKRAEYEEGDPLPPVVEVPWVEATPNMRRLPIGVQPLLVSRNPRRPVVLPPIKQSSKHFPRVP